MLVIDDEPDVRQILREYLEMLGHEVLEGANGLEAMPWLGGLDAIKHIQKFDPRIRIMVVSGNATREAESTLGTLGVPVLHKPIDLAAIESFVRA